MQKPRENIGRGIVFMDFMHIFALENKTSHLFKQLPPSWKDKEIERFAAIL